MSHEISISRTGKYILVRVSESMTRDLARQVAKDAAARGIEHHLASYLYDVREATNVETVLSNYSFVHEDMTDLDLDRSARVALLTEPGDLSHDFVETLSRNAGYNVRLFTDEGSAIAWLEAPGRV